MVYYDDILNVNAYLRQKMKNNMSETQRLILDFQTLEKQFNKMHCDADNLMEEMVQAAENIGVDVSDILKEARGLSTGGIYDCAGLLLQISDSYDFSTAFQKLCVEAHEAGFIDVHPEELLSEEEMKAAENFDRALDIRFEMETGLTAKDMAILMTAVVIRVICYYAFKLYCSSETPQSPQTSDASENFFDAGKLLGGIMEKGQKGSMIRGEHQILHEKVPFDVPDNKYFRCDEILGFHPQAGWLIGVMNILTNTVTTFKMQSYSVSHAVQNLSGVQINGRVPTLTHVVYPVLHSISASKDSLLAAVVREAEVLNVTKASHLEVSSLLEHTMKAEERNADRIEKCRMLACMSSFDFTEIQQDVETSAFINKLITAVHAVQYDPANDGDVQMYAVRTNKILTVSGGIAAMINSMPAIFSGDLDKLDFGGLMAVCMSVFNTTKFWIEVKVNYLVSAYKTEIDKQLEIVDKYFQVVKEKELEVNK